MEQATFVDTNIFLRHLANDDPHKSSACFELFRKAARGAVCLTTSESVIAEVVFVLQSPKHYRLKRRDIADRLHPILSIKGLRLPDRMIFLRALDLLVEYPIDFEDCLTVAHMERNNVKTLYSYDTDFDILKNVKRIEPKQSAE